MEQEGVEVDVGALAGRHPSFPSTFGSRVAEPARRSPTSAVYVEARDTNMSRDISGRIADDALYAETNTRANAVTASRPVMKRRFLPRREQKNSKNIQQRGFASGHPRSY